MTVSFSVTKTRFDNFACCFLVDNRPNFDEYGTDRTGLKLYETQEKAVKAGKRYLRKMAKNGFTPVSPLIQ